MSDHISPLNIIVGSVILLKRHLLVFAAALGIPIIVLTTIAANIPSDDRSAFLLLACAKMLFYVLMSWMVFRLILLEEKPAHPGPLFIINAEKIFLGLRFAQVYLFSFVGVFLVLLLLILGARALGFSVFGDIDAQEPPKMENLSASYPPVLTLFSYFYARLALALPAAATGFRMSLHQSWQLTRAQQWRVFFSVSALPLLFSFIIFELSLGGAGDAPAEPATILVVVIQIAGYIFTALGAIALALCYQALAPSQPPDAEGINAPADDGLPDGDAKDGNPPDQN